MARAASDCADVATTDGSGENVVVTGGRVEDAACPVAGSGDEAEGGPAAGVRAGEVVATSDGDVDTGGVSSTLGAALMTVLEDPDLARALESPRSPAVRCLASI